METYLDCIPCLVRQVLDTCRLTSDDKSIHEEVLREALSELSKEDWSNTPPVVAQKFHQSLREKLNVTDQYLETKRAQNKLALRLLPRIEKDVEASDDPLISAAHFAIAGNIIDLGVKSAGIDEAEILRAIEHAANEPLEGDIESFREKTKNAKSILYLADNAGEIVFDRLLVEQIGPEKITLAVRGAPIINDALMEDAKTAGLDKLVPLIENGKGIPGTDLSQCNDEFCNLFESADVVISKGQGNFESLIDCDREIFFLFKVKCNLVSVLADKPLDTHALVEKKAK